MEHQSENSAKPLSLLIFLINSRGGKGSGAKVLHKLEAFENCVAFNILDFAGNDKTAAEESLKEAAARDEDARVVLGGGDGTATWGFQILESLGIASPVAIMALGTANEMSRCTGWGKRFNSKSLAKFAESVRTRPVVAMDLWKVEYDVGDEVPRENERWPGLMGGFLSFGLDAAIASKFHEERNSAKSQPTILRSKTIYVKHDINEMFSQTPPLKGKLELKIDGVDVKLEKKFRCLQVLNLNSMAGGIDFFGVGKCAATDLLGEGQYTPQRLNDGKVEVVTESSVHHYNMCYLGLARARRIAQGSCVEITLKEATPMEVDGEPFLCPKGVVRVTGIQRPVVYGYKTTPKTKRLIE